MKTELKPMTVAELKVVRTNEMGAFLDAGTGNTSDDILLHKAQQTAPVSVGQVVKVFLYLDPKRRLTASMRVPKMRVGQIARLKIINVTGDGAFVDAGAERGIFMPFAEMHGRPKVGEIVWAKLYVDKSGKLAASMKVSDEIRLQKISKSATQSRARFTISPQRARLSSAKIGISFSFGKKTFSASCESAKSSMFV